VSQALAVFAVEVGASAPELVLPVVSLARLVRHGNFRTVLQPAQLSGKGRRTISRRGRARSRGGSVLRGRRVQRKKKSANTTPTQIERVDNPTVSAVTVTPPPSYTLNKTQFCEHLLL